MLRVLMVMIPHQPQTRRRLRHAAWCALAALALGGLNHANAQENGAPGATSDQTAASIPADAPSFLAGAREHLWMLQLTAEGRYAVLHRHARVPDDQLRPSELETDERVLAAAAWDRALWLVQDEGHVHRVRFMPKAVEPAPIYPTDLKPPLPLDQWDLAGLVVGRHGPVALLHQRPGASGDDTTDATTDPSADTPADEIKDGPWMLWRFLRDRWAPIALPHDLPHDAAARLAMVDPDGPRVALIVEGPPGSITVYTTTIPAPGATIAKPMDSEAPDATPNDTSDHAPGGTPDETADSTPEDSPAPPPDEWTVDVYDLPLDVSAQFTTSQKQPVVVQGDGQWSDRLTLTLLRNGTAHELGVFASPMLNDSAWLTTVYEDDVVILLVDAQGDMHWTRYDPTEHAGQLPPTVPLTVVQPPPSAKKIQEMIWFGAMVIAILILVTLWRQGPMHLRAELAAGVERAELPRRFAAGALDLTIVSGIVGAITYDKGDPTWLTQTLSIEDLIKLCATIMLFATYTTIAELLTSMTLGKWLLRCQVRDVDGNRPRAWQILVRNATKILDLLFLPMLVIMLMNPNYQRIGDMVARTVVTRRPTPPTD